MYSVKDYSGLSLTFLDFESTVLVLDFASLDDINKAYAHNLLFENLIVARFMLIYTTDHNRAVNFKWTPTSFSDLYNIFIM